MGSKPPPPQRVPSLWGVVKRGHFFCKQNLRKKRMPPHTPSPPNPLGGLGGDKQEGPAPQPTHVWGGGWGKG
jgi:hypothetical protein